MIKQKRGIGKLFMALIGLIIALPIGIQFMAYGVEEGKQAAYLLGFYADDLAVLVEAIQAAPGDVIISYPLEKDYSVELSKNSIKVTRSMLTRTAQREFHTLPGITVEESKVDGMFQISKIQGKISISSNVQLLSSCPKNSLSAAQVDVRVQPSGTPAGLSTEELELFKHSIDEALVQAGVGQTTPITTSETQPPSEQTPQQKVTFILQSTLNEGAEQLPAGITLLRPRAEGTDELAYRALTCNLLSTLPPSLTAQEIVVERSLSPYELVFNINIPQEQKILFLEQRGMYAQALVASMRP